MSNHSPAYHQQTLDLGHAEIHPTDPVVAGSYTTLTYTYTVGHPIDDTGYLKLAFRYASDFGEPQFDDPEAANYCTIQTAGDCLLMPRWDAKGHTRPWGRALYVKVTAGYLDRGDQIVITFGDRDSGSPGWRVQTFCEDTFEFKTLVDPIATYEFKELPRSPEIEIVPGPPAKAVCIAPSYAGVHDSFTYHLKLEDRWGNPISKPTALAHPGYPEPGTYVIQAEDATSGLSAQSNPVDVLDTTPARQPCWADLHGQSEETIGSNSIEDYFTFAQDYGLVDVAAHQGNDFQITDAFWETINETTARYNAPGAFITFPGYEWSGNSPLGGDRNIYYADEGGTIVHSCYDLLPGKGSRYPAAQTAVEMFQTLEGPSPFAFAHAGGRYAALTMHNPAVEIAVEIHSAWGTFEWLVDDALEAGYRIGICANSDGHKGRPGASYPGARRFGSYGGLTCILAEELTRAQVHAALGARHFFATTGHRPLLSVSASLPDGQTAMMGDIVQTDADTATLHVRTVGTAALDRIEVRNGTRCDPANVKTHRPLKAAELGKRIKMTWSGSEVRGRARMVSWDGELWLKENHIIDVEPINFWNPLQPLTQVDAQRLRWTSATTGGVAGMTLTLENAESGHIYMDTAQGNLDIAVGEIGLEVQRWPFGGLRKQVEMIRLLDEPKVSFEADIPVTLGSGDNPLYICVIQEDGHMAWSSPLYVVKT
jgi:hypothetical protein